MVTALDRAIPPVALRLIRQFGKRVNVLYSGNDPAYDPATGTTSGGDPVGVEVHAVIESYSDQVSAASDAIQRGDRKVVVAALDLPEPPDTSSAVVIDDVEHSVVDVTTIYSGEEAAIYTLQVRR